MRLVLLLVCICFIAVTRAAVCHQLAGAWQQHPDSPAAVGESSCLQEGSTLHTILGFSSYTGGELRATNAHWTLDLNTGLWTQKANAPFAGSHSEATSNGTHIFMAGGFEGDYLGTIRANAYVYDIAADAWSDLPPLPAPRAAGGLTYADGHLFYFSGLVSNTSENSSATIFELDLSNTAAGWQTLATPYPDPRNHILSKLVRPELIVNAGGDHGENEPVDLAGVYGFNPTSGAFSTLASLPTPRSHFDGAVSEGRLVIVGGRNNQATQQILGDILEYDPDGDEWNSVGTLPHQYFLPCTAIHNNATGAYLFVVDGGEDWDVIIKEVWVAPLTISCNYTAPSPSTTAPPAAIQTAASTTATTGTASSGTAAPTTAATAVTTGSSSATTASTAAATTATTGSTTTTGLLHLGSASSLALSLALVPALLAVMM